MPSQATQSAPQTRLTQEDLLRLACPVCHQPIVLDLGPATIHCIACARSYPFVDGIPVLMPDRVLNRNT
jgi:uncharacterized protein YbaR (Trm112 family)